MQEFGHQTINQATIGKSELIPGIGGYRLAVYEVFLYNVTSQNIEITDGESKSLTGPLNAFPDASAIFIPYTGAPHWKTQPGNPLCLIQSASTQVSGWINYRVERD